MSKDRLDGRTVRDVGAALAAVAPDLGPLPGGGWWFTLANGSPAGVRARLVDGEWLELATRVKNARLHRPGGGWHLLALNAQLAGAPRVAATPADGLVLRAEAAIETDGCNPCESGAHETDLADRVQRLCDAFRTALSRLHNSGAPSGDTGAAHTPGWPGDASTASGGGATQLAALCDSAGWAATEHASGEVVVILETRHAVYQARLTGGTGESFQALVPFSDVEPTTVVSRAATARLLLRLSGAVRLVKGVHVRDGEALRPGIAAACAPPRTGAEMNRLLSALSVACSLAGRETRTLTDEGLARAYLALAGSQDHIVEMNVMHQEIESHTQRTHEEERVCLQSK
jgi:hypothetical protein